MKQRISERVGMDSNEAGTQTPVLIAKQSYNYAGEVMALIVRIVITILLEIGIAFLFGFREKRLLILIAVWIPEIF